VLVNRERGGVPPVVADIKLDQGRPASTAMTNASHRGSRPVGRGRRRHLLIYDLPVMKSLPGREGEPIGDAESLRPSEGFATAITAGLMMVLRPRAAVRLVPAAGDDPLRRCPSAGSSRRC
jgi:hypothetical protein